MKDDIRIGVIGVGGRGKLADHAHAPGKGSRITAGADVDPAALEAFRGKYGTEVFTTLDYRELIGRDDLEAVFVCSPDFLHEEHAVAALQAGKAVYLEKPMAITIEGCDRILRTACETGSPLYVGHNMRHMRFVRLMKEKIAEGAIGEVKAAWCRHFVGHGGDFYFKDWHSERRNTTGLLLQKAVHDIDVLHWLCDGYTRRVNAMGALTLYDKVADRRPASERGNASTKEMIWPPLAQRGMSPVIDVEDLSMMQMELDNGVYASYMQCHYTPDYWRNYTVIGTEGRIENFGDGAEDTVVRIWNTRTSYKARGDIEIPASGISGTHGGSDPSIVAEFVRYVREGCTIATSAVAARNGVAAGCTATRSLREGGLPLDVPALDGKLLTYFGRQTSR